ncbi:MAG: TolB family protein [Rhizomicrobium sp.]
MRLTSGFVAESSPAWSPDGRYIAFVTATDDPHASGLYIVPAFGGSAQKVSSIAPRRHIFDRQIDWSPDGNSIALVDRTSEDQPFSLYLLSLNSGARLRLTRPPASTVGDTGPAFSPDGSLIAFRRTESVGCSDIFMVGIAGGAARRLTFDRRFTSGEAWTSQSSEIVFTSKRSGPELLWRIKASGGSPVLVPGPIQDANSVAISRSGNRLIYSQYVSNSNIWQMDLRSGAITRLLGSTRNDRSPQYSPDGTRITFRSDRTGTDEIWVSDTSGENAVRLTSFDGPLTGTPRWSPDGQFIAFDSRPNGNPDIYVVSANGGPPRRLTSAASEDVVPSWSADGQSIYFASNRSGSWQVWKIASDTAAERDPPKQVTRQGGFAAFESLDGSNVFYAKGRDEPGLWSIPARGGKERPLPALLQVGYWGDWGVAQGGLFFVRPLRGGGAEVEKYEFASGHMVRVALLEKDLPFSDSGFSVSRDGRRSSIRRWTIAPAT